MSDPSGSTSWSYDARGRMTQETKVISGSGTFATQWGYNSADMVAWMKYPSNNSGGMSETVNYTYYPQLAVDTLSGSSVYVSDTSYDALGRVVSRILGGGLLTQAYTYYGWTETALVEGVATPQGARLKQSTASGLQTLLYTYDRVGNVKTIKEATNSNQKQCFQYDNLHRLTQGTTYGDAAQGCTSQLGVGNYDEDYSYNEDTGNLANKAGVGYTYGDTSHDHAVTSLTNGDQYRYDANGNMILRMVGTTQHFLEYDIENRLARVQNALFADSFEGGNFNAWSSAVTDGGDLSVSSAAALKGSKGMQAVIDDNTAIYVASTSPTAEASYTVHFRFDPNSVSMAANDELYLLRALAGDSTGVMDVLFSYSGSAYRVRARLLKDDGASTYTSYYTISDGPHQIEVNWRAGSNGGMTLWIDGVTKAELKGLNNANKRIENVRLGACTGIDTGTRGTIYLDDFVSWGGSSAATASFVYDGDSNRVKSVEGGVTTAYVGSHFEWSGSTTTMKKYYYIASTRIAVRSGNKTANLGLTYLLGDHLGSTSVAYSYNLVTGSWDTTRQRYLPWGTVRHSSGTLPTDYTFTGQKTDSYINLMWYNSRWYDPYLNQWTQPDNIIPDPYTPSDWNRFLYVRANPLKYVDPSGHICIETGNGGEICTADDDSNGWWVPPLPDLLDKPQVIQITPGVVIIVMPEGFDPAVRSQELAEAFGYGNALIDAGEAGLSLSVFLGFSPGPSLSTGLSFVDIAVAGMSSYFDGETGMVQLDPSLPPMILLGQDPIITAAEAIVIPLFNAILVTSAATTGSLPNTVGAIIVSSLADACTSSLSVVYDLGRVEGQIPTVFAVGFYWDNNSHTRIPLPGIPVGQPVIAMIVYQQ